MSGIKIEINSEYRKIPQTFFLPLTKGISNNGYTGGFCKGIFNFMGLLLECNGGKMIKHKDG